jgi:phospholipid/cholesterol/gamma-HCH transport system substrate-binding protein
MTHTRNSTQRPPYKRAGSALLVAIVAALALLWAQFRGDFAAHSRVMLVASRAGLLLDPGAKVTYDGVEIGRVAALRESTMHAVPKAEITLDLQPNYLRLMPANVNVTIQSSTVFGTKYVAFSLPERPSPTPLPPGAVIDVSSATTEFDTLFESVVAVAEKVDPIKLNTTLTAAAQALDGLGQRLGTSIQRGNTILADLNPRMPQVRYDIQRLAELAETYADNAPDLLDALQQFLTTARTLNRQHRDVDLALAAAIGASNSGADIFERGGPDLIRALQDLTPTSQLLNEYSPEIFCTIRNFHDVEPGVAHRLGGNGYSSRLRIEFMGAANPYVYPDNLPRVNAKGGPEGRPGCWQPITRDLWPAPYLVMDTGASIAPYNHLGLGQPMFTEYVWGRQIGENTINP